MKRSLVLATLVMCIAIASLVPCSAGTRSVTLPKGTKTVNLGRGHYKFILPNQTVEVTGLDPAKGSFSLLVVISRSPRPRLLWGGKQGRLVNARKLNTEELARISRLHITRIGGDTFALPLTLTTDEASTDEASAEDMASSFLMMNIDDPGKDGGSSDLANLLAESCKAKNGKWNPETKKCEF